MRYIKTELFWKFYHMNKTLSKFTFLIKLLALSGKRVLTFLALIEMDKLITFLDVSEPRLFASKNMWIHTWVMLKFIFRDSFLPKFKVEMLFSLFWYRISQIDIYRNNLQDIFLITFRITKTKHLNLLIPFRISEMTCS